MEQENKDNNGNKLDGFFIVDNGNLPISKEGFLFIGWMEMRLKECIEQENYEEAEKLKRDIQKTRENMVIINDFDIDRYCSNIEDDN